MKSSYQIEQQLDSFKYQKPLEYDKIEIDNPDKRHPKRLQYHDRLRTILNIVKKLFPRPAGILIGDFACAQANVGLTLAELGYKVFAVDVNPLFIEYSKLKYEKGDIEWLVSNINDLDFPLNALDIAIAGELIEHCAYPEEVVKKILSWVRPGGYLLLTTQNGSMISFDQKQPLPTFAQVSSKEKRRAFEKKQFGPGGEDHLFLFELEQIKYIVPSNAAILETGYCGGTVLLATKTYYRKYRKSLLTMAPVHSLEQIERNSCKCPVINRKSCYNIYALIRKNW